MIHPLEQQVTSLELSKKLKELGCPQDSLFYWWKPKNIDGHHYMLIYEQDLSDSDSLIQCISAYTVAELLELLPKYLRINRCNDIWEIGADPRVGLIQDLIIENEIKIANVFAQVLTLRAMESRKRGRVVRDS